MAESRGEYNVRNRIFFKDGRDLNGHRKKALGEKEIEDRREKGGGFGTLEIWNEILAEIVGLALDRKREVSKGGWGCGKDGRLGMQRQVAGSSLSFTYKVICSKTEGCWTTEGS